MSVDGRRLKLALLGSLDRLAANQEEVNRLNVFPVPDGDTGTNMLLTLQSAVDDIRESEAQDIGKIAALAAHGSLMGARGNSGVILSQIFRGFAKQVQGKSELAPGDLAAALEEAANAAYRAVIKPTEGTILTVAREAGRAASTAAEEAGATIRSVIEASTEAARAAVERTPTQLAILKEAGVVDAGGFGLQLMLEGFLKGVEGGDGAIPAGQHRSNNHHGLASRPAPAAAAAQKSLALPEAGWGYCTEFILEGKGLDVEDVRDRIAAMGNSVLVVGEPELIKVHVHTQEPAKVIGLASEFGSITKLKVDDMSEQHRLILEESSHEGSDAGAGRTARPAPRQDRPNGVGLVAVVAGEGLIGIFRGLGVDAIVEGGQTMNPSTQDMLNAVNEVPYPVVLLLPNNKNVLPAAAEVARLTAKTVHVVRSRSVPQGIASVVSFSPDRDLDQNIRAMEQALDQVRTIEVTRAVRDTRADGMAVKKGDIIALVDSKLESSGSDYADVVVKALSKVGGSGRELVTVYTGEGATVEEAESLAADLSSRFPDLEVELQAGGQQHYPFILSLE
ncbi:MAG: DAK2 domain-containing protein [Candidatus Dormibacteraceae bacterium]